MRYYERYINPFTDFGFKKIFGDPKDTSLLKSLINDILARSDVARMELCGIRENCALAQ